MFLPTPNRAIDSSSEKTDRGARVFAPAILSNAFRSQSWRRGNVSWPENCNDGSVNELGTLSVYWGKSPVCKIGNGYFFQFALRIAIITMQERIILDVTSYNTTLYHPEV